MSEQEYDPGDVAIIGMSCRFPGARNKEQFWDNLVHGRDSITRLSKDEVEVDETLLNNPAYVLACGALDGYDEFDPAVFGISDRMAAKMTPEHRLFLESAWEVLEDGGYDPERFEGEVGIYGASNPQTAAVYSSPPDWVSAGPEVMERSYGWMPDTLTSNALFHLGLLGETLSVAATCTGFHQTVHLACQSLLLGQTDMAIAGGVIVRLPHRRGYLWEEGSILSRDGVCRPFDAQGTGSVLASGVATVLLKPLQQAVADRDHIYAVVKGTATNNNGVSAMAYGTAQPERLSACIANAMQIGGVTPDTVSLYEGNGLGFPMSDSLEVHAAHLAFGKQSGICSFGSVKGNIGHAGLVGGGSGTIKAVLSLLHRQLVPIANLTEPNPDIDFPGTPFVPQAELEHWEPECGIRRAGVTAIGGGGYNAHLVLEEAPVRPHRTPESGAPRIATLSALDDQALARQKNALREWLVAHPEARLDDVCFTLNLGRKAMATRWAAVVSSREELIDALATTPSPGDGSLSELATAWTKGQRVDFEALHAGEESHRVALPTYPFERRRIWRTDW